MQIAITETEQPSDLSTKLVELVGVINARQAAKREVLLALFNFHTALVECKKVVTSPEFQPEEVSICFELMDAGILELQETLKKV